MSDQPSRVPPPSTEPHARVNPVDHFKRFPTGGTVYARDVVTPVEFFTRMPTGGGTVNKVDARSRGGEGGESGDAGNLK